MRVLVTGSKGYIGTVLVPMLLREGHEVIGVDTDYFEACTFSGDITAIPEYRQDVRDDLREVLSGCHAVVHLAGLSNDPLGDYRPAITEEINYRAAVKLAHKAKAAGVKRFIFASSCSNYGAAGREFLTETAAFNPVTPYGISKVRVEQALNKLADSRFSPTYLRASTAYGMSPRLRFDLVLNNLTAWAFTTGHVQLKSDGTPWRPIVHVEDICRAYVAVLHAPRDKIHNEAFNVGLTTENYQIKELADIVQDVVPGSRVAFSKNAGRDTRCYRVDCNKIARTLHEYKPQWTARRGVEELYSAYQTSGLKLEDFEGPRYMRIAHIKKLINDNKLDQELRWTRQQESGLKPSVGQHALRA